MQNDLFPLAILAGGLAKRLHPVTRMIPKSLIEINGSPFISHQLRLLSNNEIKKVVICTGYLGEKIVEYLDKNDKFGIEIHYSFDGPVLLGTGGAVKKALPLLGENFFVMYGDSYLQCDYRLIQQAYQNSRKIGLMTIYRNEGKWDKSNVEYSAGRIINYDKSASTDRMQFIDYGLGIFNKRAFDQVPENVPIDLSIIYKNLIASDELFAFEVSSRFYEIGTQKGIADLENYLKRKYNLTE